MRDAHNNAHRRKNNSQPAMKSQNVFNGLEDNEYF